MFLRRNLPLLVATLGIGASVSGCSSRLPQLARDLSSVVENNAGVPAVWRAQPLSDAVRSRIQKYLQDGVSSDRAVEIALLANPDLQAEFERLGVGQAEVLAGGAASDPVVSWSDQALRGGPGSKLEYAILVGLTDWITWPQRRSAAQRELDAAKFSAANRVLALIANVRGAWLDSLAANKDAALAAQRADLARLEAELMGRFVSAGNEPARELAEKQQAHVAQQLTAAAAAERQLTARTRLERLMGVSDLAIGWEPAGEFAPLPGDDGELTDLESAALRNRLDLQAARRHAEAKLAALGDARLRRAIPELRGGYGRERDPDGSVTAGPNLELQLPLFSAAQHALARSDASSRLALREAEAAALDVRGEVRAARERVAQARSALVLVRDVELKAAEKLADARQREFFYMLVGPFAAMEARGSVIDAQRRQVDAERAYWQARLELARAAALPLRAIKEWTAATEPAP